MSDSSLKRRLSALRRPDPAARAALLGGAGVDLGAGAAADVGAGALRAEPVGVGAYLPGGEMLTEHGAFYVHERRRSELDKGTARFLRRLARAESDARKLDVHEELARLLTEGLDRALFLDLETTGLSQTPLFLVGLMSRMPADWSLRQLFARHYAEERALVAHTLELLRERPILVTFNGRTFDWPFLKMRAAYHRIKVDAEPFHLDLLRHARRHWRGEFEDCRLQTLEWRVVGRRRCGDVDGAEIPGRYHRYVKNGDPYPLVPVFHHNMLDLVAMADLLVEMLERELGGPVPEEVPEEVPEVEPELDTF